MIYKEELELTLKGKTTEERIKILEPMVRYFGECYVRGTKECEECPVAAWEAKMIHHNIENEIYGTKKPFLKEKPYHSCQVCVIHR